MAREGSVMDVIGGRNKQQLQTKRKAMAPSPQGTKVRLVLHAICYPYTSPSRIHPKK